MLVLVSFLKCDKYLWEMLLFCNSLVAVLSNYLTQNSFGKKAITEIVSAFILKVNNYFLCKEETVLPFHYAFFFLVCNPKRDKEKGFHMLDI